MGSYSNFVAYNYNIINSLVKAIDRQICWQVDVQEVKGKLWTYFISIAFHIFELRMFIQQQLTNLLFSVKCLTRYLSSKIVQ